MDLRLIMRFLVRLWRQQPINSTLSRTNEVPETTPISNSKPDMLFLPVVLEVVVGRTPAEKVVVAGHLSEMTKMAVRTFPKRFRVVSKPFRWRVS